jgi:hypothetical protein
MIVWYSHICVRADSLILIEYMLKFCENCVLYGMILYVLTVGKWSKIMVLVMMLKCLTVGLTGGVG